MGIKTWIGFTRAIDGPPTERNVYAWVRRDPGKRTVPSSKYWLKIVDALLHAAAKREAAYVDRIQALEGRLANRVIPCDRCPLAGLQLPAAMTAQRGAH